MTKRISLLPVLLGAVLLAVSSAAHAQNAGKMDVRQIAERVDRHYNQLHSLQANFTESYEGGGLRRVESGTLWMKKPGAMRWEYSSPRPKLFVTDGRTAWFYVPGERQARKAQVKRLGDFRSPLRYLLGRTKLQKELRGLSFAPDQRPQNPQNVVLRGVPAGMEDRISQVLLEAAPSGALVRIYIEELDGSRTDFQLRNEKENVSVADQRFHFAAPAGVEVMEAKELEP